MIENYWFPALPVFPDNAKPVVSESFPSSIQLNKDQPVFGLRLGDQVSDADNMDASIIKSVVSLTPASPFNSIIRNDSLIVSTTKNPEEKHEAKLILQFNSNGQILTKELAITSGYLPTAIEDIETPKVSLYPNPASDYVTISVPEGNGKVELFTIQGQLTLRANITGTYRITISHLPKGVYIVRVSTKSGTTTQKLIKQ